MSIFLHHLELCAPLFLLVFLGWFTIKIGLFDKAVSSALSKFVFKLLMPVLLFKIMSGLSEMPPVDWKVLIAFFASCVVVFLLGKYCGKYFSVRTAQARSLPAWAAFSATTCSSVFPLCR